MTSDFQNNGIFDPPILPESVWDVPMDVREAELILETIRGVEALQYQERSEQGVPGYPPISAIGEVAFSRLAMNHGQTAVPIVE